MRGTIARGMMVLAGLALVAGPGAAPAATPDEQRMKALDNTLADMGEDAMALLAKAKGERLAGDTAKACFHQAAGLAGLQAMHQPAVEFAALRARAYPDRHEDPVGQIDGLAAEAKARLPASCPSQVAAIAQRDALKGRYAKLRAAIDTRQAELDATTPATMAALKGPNPKSACPNLLRARGSIPQFRTDIAELERLNREGGLNREQDLENLHGNYDAEGKVFEQLVAQKCG